MKWYVLFLFITVLAACDQQQKPLVVTSDSVRLQNDGTPDTAAMQDQLYTLSPLTGTLLIKLKLDSNTARLTIPLRITSGKELFGVLNPADTMAAIRFSQIVCPDGTTDGPFGRELHYAFTSAGTYRLIVSENNMAGDNKRPVNTDLQLWVK